ncbi:MAG: AAA family ATPase [Treponema sp.]|nr:AAA family ATPase [Treponema sp.]
MDCLKSLHIEGFKKFKKLNIEFNDRMNILVGENEAGKSTILDAIKTVLNQQYKNADKSILKELFNVEFVKEFKKRPCVRTLPRIYMELTFSFNPKNKNSEYFYGENNIDESEKFGISFECIYDEELGAGLEAEIEKGNIPYEYYAMRWKGFSGNAYQILKTPLKSIFIDTSSADTTYSFNSFNKNLFYTKISNDKKLEAKNTFRNELPRLFDALNLPEIDESKKFGINDKKIILENILSIYDDDIQLENKGSGMENLVKTRIALDRRNEIDVILLEEPENHLSFTNLRKMIEEISNKKSDAQIIIATHNNMITSRLGLKNVLWITNDVCKPLSSISTEDASFFEKNSNNSFLELLLSEKIILVEGSTEYMMIPYFYTQKTKRTLEADAIHIISCNGISYEHYLSIAKSTEKKIAVITDNDGSTERINIAEEFNKNTEKQHIFMGKNITDWTWEVCLYHKNKEILDKIFTPARNAKYLIHGKIEPETQNLGKMLSDKAEAAYKIITTEEPLNLVLPDYVEEAIKWLNS